MGGVGVYQDPIRQTNLLLNAESYSFLFGFHES